jgi:prepilin-type N-terminal cleavage/methylation domain-containing protein
MSSRSNQPRRAFTLVEMLVVIGIIGVLVAILVPTAMVAVSRMRDARMVIEIGELEKAIQTYKQRKGDYPPSMGEIDLQDLDGDGNRLESLYLVAPYTSVVERHLQKCYPKMTQAEKVAFYTYVAPYMTQSEALWFWLSQTQNDERSPFFSAAKNYMVFYDFDQERVAPTQLLSVTINNSTVPFQLNAYRPSFAKDTAFVYLDSRTYHVHGDIDRGAPFSPVVPTNGPVQPYFDDKNPPVAINPKTYQIICAGQDGEFGAPVDMIDNNGNVIPNSMKQFISGRNYTDEDKDNLTNFSNGKRLGASIPGA